ncbi:right-handed parallel beta-helix repeat-containing protein [Paenibacillus contaminans]|uniref:Periplasmic copper-binding protein NosD beta helix domain-containing protein n=1 Tax=Paenibacillus contaminans TaxID=450362 RepID=A0A329MW91_9BACL|nr:right-handed parallel beta-helix repeat-containing protein [Paenibacillus contaminans]RAV23096.1 hypothetical protein DQG23_02565 [Paenibacillus contaminans]
MEVIEITVGHQGAALTGTTNEIIQLAIDRVSSLGGGIVTLLPGKYAMHDSIHLRSNVVLRGSGTDTVLWKPPSVSSPVKGLNGYGLYAVAVDHPDKFDIGSGIFITDDLSNAFYDTVATVCWKDGNDLGLSKPLNHDISARAKGTATTVYPIVCGYDVENVRLEHFVIEGNASENKYIHGCRGGGVFFMRSKHIQMANLTVKDYNGDGISFQQCINTHIENCSCLNNAGIGLHPGSGSVGFVIRNSTFRGNKEDGIYYCLRVSYSSCENCIIENNGRDGLSIGHRDTDLIIRGNLVKGNGRYGVYLRNDAGGRSGDRVLIAHNEFQDNCADSGNAELFFDAAAEDVRLIGNAFTAVERQRDSLFSGVYVNHPGCIGYIDGNRTSGYSLLSADSATSLINFSTALPEQALDVEHKPVPAGAMRHLNG